jgi:acyl transferase domain-containing protein/NAD(P)-dependent dehydrogenase (short-subunit alcohol dehydrogenase family)/acyl carrier protein
MNSQPGPVNEKPSANHSPIDPANTTHVPLAIIGIGCLFPRAQSARAFWLNIKNGVDAVGPIPSSHWNPEEYLHSDPKAADRVYTARGAFLDPVDFNPLEFGIAPNDLEAIDTSQLLGLVAARQALVDAGYGPEHTLDRSRISIILGVTGTLELVIPLGARLGHPKWRKALEEAGVDRETAEEVVERIADSYVSWQENSFPGLLGNVVAGRIANRLDLGGTNCVVDAACASSLSAIHLAGLELATGRCDVAVTGGIDTFNDIFMYMCFSKTPALSPTGNAKPFDSSGDGTILGEGLGIVVLKRLADAERDGDRIYAVIKSIGSSSDGKGNAIYAPSAAGQVKALRTAYKLAGITPDTIELVEGHGTGTKVGDTVEATALSTVYGDTGKPGSWCAVGSVKSQIGHTKAAAGAAGLIKATLALHHKVLPPTIKVKQPVDPFLPGKSPFYVNTEKRPWVASSSHPRRAAVSAFGFGGSNFHCVLEEHQNSKPEVDWDGEVEIVALQGASTQELANQLANWPSRPVAPQPEFSGSGATGLPRPNDPTWSTIRQRAAQSRSLPLASDACRLVLVIQRGHTDVAKLVASARAMLERNPQARFWHSPDGAYFGKGPACGPLAVVFPGQGSQYVGMLRDLACQFPQMREVLGDANRVFERMRSGAGGYRLSDQIYPVPAFSAETRAEQDQRLRDTQVAQPAIGAVSLGALKVLESFGLEPGMYAGHSYGELPALCAAGCFDDHELHQLSRLRGHLMASFHGQDAGTMLAVHSPVEIIESVLHEDGLGLVIANRNSPTQSVLSGATVEIDRALSSLERRKIRYTRLPVAAAFHSPLVAPAQVPFREALDAVGFRKGRSPVFANSSSRQYPTDPDSMRQILAEQLAKPVDFVQQIGNMIQTGVRTFVEVGPGSTLTRLIESIVKGNVGGAEVDAFALDASSGKRPGALDLAHALARLAARGFNIHVDRWEIPPKPETTARPAMTVPICGANYVKARPKRESKPKRIAAPPTPPNTPIPSTNAEVKPVNTGASNPLPPGKPVATPPTSAPVDGTTLSQALQITQQSLAAFQKLQEQTAQLHRQFLTHQEASQKTLQLLVEQQQSLILAGMGAAPQLRAITIPVPPAPPATIVNPPLSQPAPIVVPEPVPLVSVASKADVATVAPASQVEPAIPFANSNEVEHILLTVVAEKTGYPVEMLSPEMALDSDLGIDSIKRVEILSTLQDRLPNAPAVKAEQLGTFQTLRDIIHYLEKADVRPAERNGTVAKTPTAPFGQSVESILLAVVAEKTGYPAEMLALEMSLDADLGIDSIKRVEILSTLQERLPSAPVVKPEQLGQFRTLQDVVQFLAGSPVPVQVEKPQPSAEINQLNLPPALPDLVISPAPAGSIHDFLPPDPPAPPEPESSVQIERSILQRVPLDQKRQRRKIVLPKGSTIWIIAEASSLTAKVSQFVSSYGYRAEVIAWNDSPYAYGPRGVAGLILIAPDGLLAEDFHLRAFRWMKHAGSGLVQAARHNGAVFAAVTRFDGSFGLGQLDPGRDPGMAALLGLVKTAAREWPDVSCKVIDCDPTTIRQLAAPLVEEVFLAGPAEVGLALTERFTLELRPTPLPAGEFTPLLGERDIVLVSGGARGVTAAAALAIAESCQSTLVLLGRTPKLENEPDWLASRTGEADVKKAMADRLGPDLTPRDLEKKYRQLLGQREVRDTIHRLQTAGSQVIYRPIDVQDTHATRQAIAEIRQEIGRFTAVVHGAGVLADRRIEDLTDDQFESVYSTKVAGLRNLLLALGDDPLKAMVFFSSSTGRFGRTGQSAYAAANEVLNKAAQQQARLRKNCRVVSINWGPWEGGMVTPALQKMFEQEGVGAIPLRKGGNILVRELSAADRSIETVVIARIAEPSSTLVSEPAPAMPAAPDMTPAFERVVSIQEHPILRSHVIDGRAVLPMALHIEWLAHAALHGNPGMVFQGINDLRIHQGVYLDESAPALIRVLSGKPVKRDGAVAVPVELRGRHSQREVIHSRAEIVLGYTAAPAETPAKAPALEPYPRTADEFYRSILFHGTDLQALENIEGCSEKGIVGLARTAPAPSNWMANPNRSSWLTDPLAIDCCFQMMILWSHARHGAGSLPCYFARYRQYRRAFPSGSIRMVAQLKRDNGSLASADIDFLDSEGNLVARMLDYEFVIDKALNATFRKNQLARGK